MKITKQLKASSEEELLASYLYVKESNMIWGTHNLPKARGVETQVAFTLQKTFFQHSIQLNNYIYNII